MNPLVTDQTCLKGPGKEQRTVCYENIKNIRFLMDAITSFILIY